jgi:hypothetical protein
MKYILLLRQDPSLAPAEGTPEADADMQQWGALYGELSSSGALVSGTGLESEEAATTLRTRDGAPLITDGPFAETKEMLFSFFVLNADDLDEALAWAKKMPCAQYGSVEVRPLSIHSQ